MAAVSPEAIAPCLCCCPLLAHSKKGVLCPLSLMVRLRTPAPSHTRSTLTPPYFRTGSASFPLKQSRCDDDLILGCYFCVQNAITLFKQHTLKSLNCTPAPHYDTEPDRLLGFWETRYCARCPWLHVHGNAKGVCYPTDTIRSRVDYCHSLRINFTLPLIHSFTRTHTYTGLK